MGGGRGKEGEVRRERRVIMCMWKVGRPYSVMLRVPQHHSNL